MVHKAVSWFPLHPCKFTNCYGHQCQPFRCWPRHPGSQPHQAEPQGPEPELWSFPDPRTKPLPIHLGPIRSNPWDSLWSDANPKTSPCLLIRAQSGTPAP